MKKVIYATLMVALTSIMFTACIDDDTEVYENNTQTVDKKDVKPPTGG